MALIECVPNFSEGRNPAVLDAIVAAMLEVPGAYLLAREMDPDHHRSVVTLAGEGAAVAEAVVRGAGAAAERIDLRQHRGAHPRVGATDVVPFVPLEGATLDECVRWAEWTGAEIWRRYQIPVYLYEAAARRPERRQLEVVRRGQFEGLREDVRTDPERQPDFGWPFEKAGLHPSAGATIVGARKFLIAYNINLDTPDVEIARSIARTIRASGGGLPAVKAMGVRLNDPARAQVSMNLTDFEVTSLATVWQTVGGEATKRGVRAVESELVGLLPRAALETAGAELLRFSAFDSQRVIENRLSEVRRGAQLRHAAGLVPWLEALASEHSSPGAGSAAAATGAMAAAVGERVAGAAMRLEQRESGPDRGVAYWKPIEAEMKAARMDLTRAVDEDSEASLALLSARRLPLSPTAAERARTSALEQATLHAAEVPLEIAVRCLQLEHRLNAMQTRAASALGAETAAARLLALAGYQTAALCAAAQLRLLPPDHPAHQRIQNELDKLNRAVHGPSSDGSFEES